MEPGWTEIVQRDEEITDPAEGRRLVEARLAARGVSVDDLDNGDIEMRQWLVRRDGGELRSHVYTYLVRDEALSRFDSNK